MPRFLRWCFYLTLCVASAFASPAWAQTDDDTAARSHFLLGSRHLDRGEYEDAAREFNAAYELSHRTPLLYNLYVAYERQGDYAHAENALARFLTESGDGLENRDALESRLENLRRRLAEQATAVDTETAEEQAPDVEATPSERPSRTGAYVAMGIGGAGLATFAIAGALALAEDGALADQCGRDADRTCTRSQLGSLRRRTITADVGLGIGVAGAVTTLVLFLLPRAERTDAQATGITPLVEREGETTYVGVRGWF